MVQISLVKKKGIRVKTMFPAVEGRAKTRTSTIGLLIPVETRKRTRQRLMNRSESNTTLR